jgi:hypothetical protein
MTAEESSNISESQKKKKTMITRKKQSHYTSMEVHGGEEV